MRHSCASAQQKTDWALEVAELVEGRQAGCKKMTLVLDHRNTHPTGAFDQALEPIRARDVVRLIESCDTPHHAGWLNTGENESSTTTRQCLSGRHLGDLNASQAAIAAWASDVNGHQRGVDWRLKIDDARRRLKSVCPRISF